MFVCLSFYRLSDRLSVCLSVYLSVWLCLSVYLSVFVCLFVCLSVCLSVYRLSVSDRLPSYRQIHLPPAHLEKPVNTQFSLNSLLSLLKSKPEKSENSST